MKGSRSILWFETSSCRKSLLEYPFYSVRSTVAMMYLLVVSIFMWTSQEVLSQFVQPVPSNSSCGVQYFNESDTSFVSPNYPSNYTSNAECSYYAEGPEGHIVLLIFDTFQVEDGWLCSMDYVSVYDGHSVDNQTLIRTFCGSKVPGIIASSDRYMLVTVTSYAFVEGASFSGRFLFLEDNCNLEFNQTGSMFTSANYHEEYNSSTLCTYRAVAKPGQYIALTFLSFDVEVSPGCIYDAVTVYDGGSIYSPIMDTFCGTLGPKTLFSSENELLVVMVANRNKKSDGFKALLTFREDNCSHHLRDNNTEVSSINFPGNYSNFEKCDYVIEAPQGMVVVVKFLAFDIEQSKNCSKDVLSIASNLDDGFRLVTFCGSQIPDTFTSNGSNKLLLKFRTDNEGTKTGFSILISFTAKLCETCSVTDRFYGICPDDAIPPSSSERSLLDRLPPSEFLQCGSLTVEDETTYDGKYFWMISDCPNHANSSIRMKCNGFEETNGESKKTFSPPVRLRNFMIGFKNRYCAVCNGFGDESWREIEVLSVCSECSEFDYKLQEDDILDDEPYTYCETNIESIFSRSCNYSNSIEEDRSCPGKKSESELLDAFSHATVVTRVPVAPIPFSHVECSEGHIDQNGHCQREFPFEACPQSNVRTILVLTADRERYRCRYLKQRSMLCFEKEMKLYNLGHVQRNNITGIVDNRKQLVSFELHWKTIIPPPNWIEPDIENSQIVFELPKDVSTKKYWKENVKRVINNTLDRRDSCYIKSLDIMELCTEDKRLPTCNDGDVYRSSVDKTRISSYEKGLTITVGNMTFWHLDWYGVITKLIPLTDHDDSETILFCSTDDGNIGNTGSEPMVNDSFTIIIDICCGIAVICLLLTFLIYLFTSELRNTFSIAVMAFVLTLATSIILLQFVNPYIQTINWFCVSMAVVAHWTWVSVFCWMTILAYDLRSTFDIRNIRVADRIHGTRLRGYFVYSWGCPTCLVAVCVLLWNFTSIPIFYGSYDGKSCWIYKNTAAIVVVSGPLILSLSANLVFFTLMVRAMMVHKATSKGAKITSRRSKKTIPEIIICIKISLLMGFAWLSGYIAPLTGIHAFNYLFALFVSLKGLLILVFFGTNERIRKLWRQKLRKATSKQFSTTNKELHRSNDTKKIDKKPSKGKEKQTIII